MSDLKPYIAKVAAGSALDREDARVHQVGFELIGEIRGNRGHERSVLGVNGQEKAPAEPGR